MAREALVVNDAAPCEECAKGRRVAAIAGYGLGIVVGGAVVFLYLRSKATAE